MKFSFEKTLIPFFLIVIVLTIMVRHHFFFWDTVQLGSYHAHYFYETQFSSLILPSYIDSGHFPGLGIYLAACWTLFGKTLPVSHFAMLPFLIGIVWQVYRIGTYFSNQKKAAFLLLLLFADPCFLGQSILMSPDICLLFFFLLALNGVLRDKTILIGLASVGLAATSLRGMMIVVALFLFKAIFFTSKDFKNLAKTVLPFVPSGLFALAFLAYHYQQTGWAGYHEDSPWSSAFETVNFKEFLHNIVLLGWRFLDYGRVFILLTISFLFLSKALKNTKFDPKLRQSLGLVVLLVLLLTPSILTHKYLMAHRYLFPIFFSLSLFAFYLIVHYTKRKRLWFLLLFVGLFSGNLWIYPKGVAQGWDSTLAHVPYYQLRNQMIDYIDQAQIPISSIGTAFPNRSGLKYTDLTNRDVLFPNKDLANQDYIFYSNIFNEFTNEEINELEQNWDVLKKYERMRINVILYKKRK